MKLIGTYVSPYARRVATALVSRAIPYEHEGLNGYADPIRAREFNPVGKVPVLELDDGERLIDSGAILDHINELVGPERALIPESGAARRSALRLSAISATVCEQTTARRAAARLRLCAIGAAGTLSPTDRRRAEGAGCCVPAERSNRHDVDRYRHHQRRRGVRICAEVVSRP